MEFKLVLYLMIIILCFSLNPFFKKKILNKKVLNVDEYFMVNHFIVTGLLLVYFVILIKNKQCSIECWSRLDRYDIMYILLGSFTSIIGARLLISLIKKKDITYLMVHLQPIVIAITFIEGYVFFKEKITLNKIMGILFILTGLIFINRN